LRQGQNLQTAFARPGSGQPSHLIRERSFDDRGPDVGVSYHGDA
jgi:hypothetical protein